MSEDVRIGVFVCHCGINIGGVVNVPEVVKYAKTLPGVVHSEGLLYTCSSDGTARIKEAIKKYKLNRVVVASCTPRTHEPLFREICKEAGLNEYLFHMANIREQCSWVHMHEPKKATEKAKVIVRMAVAKARLLEPQERPEVKISPSALVIGAGISGMQASLCLANQGFKVFLVEKEAEPGGMLRKLYKLYPTEEEASKLLELMLTNVKANENINLLTSTVIKEVKGYIGNFEVTALKDGKKEIKFRVGTIIVATGAEELKPIGLYGYGDNKNVVTQLELESLLKRGLPKEVNRVVMIQCVGAMSENGEGVKYCSRICCATALKNAILMKESKPSMDVYIIYRDLQAYGREYEEYYLKAQRLGVKFINYVPDKPPEVKCDSKEELKVTVYFPLIDKSISINCDLVVLSTPLIQHETGKEISKILKVPLGPDEFFLEAHPKLRPVDFTVDGIYVCGTAQGPKSISESIAQAYAAASRASIPMTAKRIRTEAITAIVDENLCKGCGKCEEVCEFNAIKVEPKVFEVAPFIKSEVLVAKVNDILCKGCGVCSVACPTGAIKMRHFTNEQILAEVSASIGGP